MAIEGARQMGLGRPGAGASSGPIIEARGLRRTFTARGGDVEAVRGVDLDVGEGEIVGFLGPNGAGKTTTLRMLTTLLEPSGGVARVAGHDLALDPVAVRRAIGYVPQSGSTFPEALAGEEIVDHARLYGIRPAVARARGEELFSALELGEAWERRCSTLSGGQRRRLDIAMGLIHEPALVFLDEPSTGLDPQSRANLWQHVRALRDRFETTVFLTTHYMDEADLLCDRIFIIDHGEVVVAGTPDDLKRKVSGDTVTLTFAEPGAAGVAGRLGARLAATTPTVEGTSVRFNVADGGAVLQPLLRALDEAGVEARGVEVRRPSLDDVFLEMTGRSLREQAA